MKRKKKRRSTKSHKKLEFNYIPPEIWTQILALSPVKTLVRFRCVSKTWCSIIDSPDFVYMHLQLYSISNKKLLRVREDLGKLVDYGFLMSGHQAATLRKPGFTLKCSQSRYHIHASCNGLLLMRFTQQCLPDPVKYSLWNPSVRKSLLLPPCPITFPSINISRYELGFAPTSKDYKVVVISINYSLKTNKPTRPSIAVYTLSTQQWTIVRDNGLHTGGIHLKRVFGNIGTTTRRSFYFEGAAHWFGYNPFEDNRPFLYEDGYYMAKFTHLVSFNYDSEKFAFLKLPHDSDEVETSPSCLFLFLLGESLAIFSISEVRAKIWVLEQDEGKEVWILWFTGKSNRFGFNLFLDSIGSKIFYNESDGGFLNCRKGSYRIASGKAWKHEESVEFEMFAESLALLKDSKPTV